MSESKTPDNICEHGSIRRKCAHCDVNRLESDLAAAQARIAELEAMVRQHRCEFLGEIQRRVIDLGGDPPIWPSRNDIEAHDDVESAAQMILGLLQRIAELEADARRYRWLRERNDRNKGAIFVVFDNNGVFPYYPPAADIDAAIDAALAAKEKNDA